VFEEATMSLTVPVSFGSPFSERTRRIDAGSARSHMT
jgi:hypothetical protein